jgi:hypothetical protein
MLLQIPLIPIAALNIEPLETFFCGAKIQELLRLLCDFPHKMMTQVVQ